MKRLKVVKYDSLMTKENNYDAHKEWTMSRAFKPKNLEWVYAGGIQPEAAKPAELVPCPDGIVLFTDKDIVSPFVDQVQAKYKLVYLSECRTIHPLVYQWMPQFENKFDYIFTHDTQLLVRDPKYVLNVLGTSWLTDGEAKIYEKTKMFSHIASKQSWSPGHKLRHLITKVIQNKKLNVDLWGSAINPFDKKTEPLADYFFSITVMNAKHDNYFTETLVDNFRAGTIPIFWGCGNIGKFFNEKGIIRFNSGPELLDLIKNLTPKDYYSRMEHIKENFEIAKKYKSVDDVLGKNIIKTLGLKGYECE
jgi:hypothetical protein